MTESRIYKRGDRIVYNNYEDGERTVGTVIKAADRGANQILRIEWDDTLSDGGRWWSNIDPELSRLVSDTVKPKWAVGDRILFTDEDDGELAEGTVDEVAFERYSPDTHHIHITWDDGQEDLSWWDEHDPELTPLASVKTEA